MSIMPQKNCRTWDFKQRFTQLPQRVKELATKAFVLFLNNPLHPALRLHKLKNSKNTSHLPESYSVSIGMYRAVFVMVGDVNVWYWIGSHAEFDTFAG